MVTLDYYHRHCAHFYYSYVPLHSIWSIVCLSRKCFDCYCCQLKCQPCACVCGWGCVCVWGCKRVREGCVCVCVWERERERVREGCGIHDLYFWWITDKVIVLLHLNNFLSPFLVAIGRSWSVSLDRFDRVDRFDRLDWVHSKYLDTFSIEWAFYKKKYWDLPSLTSFPFIFRLFKLRNNFLTVIRSDTRDPRFESSHRRYNLLSTVLQSCTYWKDENSVKKRPRIVPLNSYENWFILYPWLGFEL